MATVFRIMPWKLGTLLLVFVAAASSDDFSARGTNAANVISAGLSACNNTWNTNNHVPFVPPGGYMSMGMGILGGILRTYHNWEMDQKITGAINDMNSRFDQLEDSMNNQFNQLIALIGRKQFESDISDPTVILWGIMQAYIQHPGTGTLANMMFECEEETAWKIALKIRNRLYGPDNMIMTQVVANKYSNATFMKTKDLITFRLFQTMMVQSFCIGLQQGPNYNISNDWQMMRMNDLYKDVVDKIVASRKQQETDYFRVMVPQIVREIVVNDDHGKTRQAYAASIYDNLAGYSWDRIAVVIADKKCDTELYYSPSYPSKYPGSVPYSMWFSRYEQSPNDYKADVYVFRFWNAPQDQNLSNRLYNSIERVYKTPIEQTLADNTRYFGGFDFVLIDSKEWCGGNTYFYPARAPNSYGGATYNRVQQASAILAPSSRPTTIEYDLGFWERPLSIQLMPQS